MRHPAVVTFSLLALLTIGGVLFALPHGAALPHVGACAKNDPRECIADRYERIAEEKGTRSALSMLHAEIEKDPGLGGICHEAMHRVGHVALREFGGIAAAYEKGNFDCGNGYYHGVIEAYANEHSRSFEIADGIRALCAGFASSSREAQNCVHGEGHALFSAKQGVLASALFGCAVLENDRFVAECASGVFMEAALERLSLASSSDPEDNPTLICATMPGDQYPCYLALAALVIEQGHEGERDAKDFCAPIGDARYRDACLHPQKNVSPVFGPLRLDLEARDFLGE